MLRGLTNILHLRKPTKNEVVSTQSVISTQDVIELLKGLGDSTANLYFNFANLRIRKLKNQSPEGITEFIRSGLGISPDQQATHQVYTRAGIEEHYINLEERFFIVTIDYEIKKGE